MTTSIGIRGNGRLTPQAGIVAAVLVLTAVGTAGCADQEKGTPASNACDATAVADKVVPSVVTISVTNGSSTVTGSGDIIRSDGYIVTNDHVISPGAAGGAITVVRSEGTVWPARIVGRDPPTDLAVIKIEAGSALPAIQLASSTAVVIGQPVIAVGSPLGLMSTVTTGIVSALDRMIDVPASDGTSAVLISAVQTDAAINPGNSGGALTDCSGKLVGVPSAVAAIPDASGHASGGNIGIGFAIPVDFAKAVADELIATGAVTHSYFGVDAVAIPSAAAKQNGQPTGLYVVGVTPGGPSDAAGLRPGDVITAIDGAPATDANQLAAITLKKNPGESVSIAYVRSGTSVETTVTLGSPP